MGKTRGGTVHRVGPGVPKPSPGKGRRGFFRALILTFVSVLLWGFAHLWMGRRKAGLALLFLYWLLITALVLAVTAFRQTLVDWAVRSDLRLGVTIGSLVLGFVWVTIAIRSYQISRPEDAPLVRRAAANATIGVLCVALAVPFAVAARYTYVYRDTLTGIFQTGDGAKKVDADNPWAGKPRVNILLLGGDAAGNRVGVRTDSMTLASVDTRTGNTVLLSLPRNLEHFPMPPGPARERFPQGFTGDGPLNPGLLNEVYEYAESHPDVVPGVPKKRRGPALVTATISEILGQPIDYYILVDMFGFADIVDAMGGVKIKIDRPIPFGQEGDVIEAGNRRLTGKEALWYGRSRNDSDDYTRMGRQKCLLRAIAQQANPSLVLTRFEQLAHATKRAISTDIPLALLPALIKLSDRVKNGAEITSLQFVPPLISTAQPDVDEIHRLTAKAIEDSEARASQARASATPSQAASATPSRRTPNTSTRPSTPPAKAISLAQACPS
jgi:anionic cell wall polymer biosynthesis LytR-Cps2A-Psr (LCP) family protein